MKKSSTKDKLSKLAEAVASPSNNASVAAIPAAQDEQQTPKKASAPSPAIPPLESASIDKSEDISSDKPSPSPVDTSLTTDNLIDKLSTLSDADRTRLRLALNKGGLVHAGAGSKLMPDGRRQFVVAVSPDIVSMLEAWAEAAGVTLEEQVQMVVDTVFPGYLYGDWQAAATPEPAPATT